jgi:hypothetical protein
MVISLNRPYYAPLMRRSKQGGAGARRFYPRAHPPSTGHEQGHGERDDIAC